MIRHANFSPKIKGFNSALKASRFCTLKSHYPSDVQYMGTADKLKFTTGFVISYLTLITGKQEDAMSRFHPF